MLFIFCVMSIDEQVTFQLFTGAIEFTLIKSINTDSENVSSGGGSLFRFLQRSCRTIPNLFGLFLPEETISTRSPLLIATTLSPMISKAARCLP
jgi:hypothetical protein